MTSFLGYGESWLKKRKRRRRPSFYSGAIADAVEAPHYLDVDPALTLWYNATVGGDVGLGGVMTDLSGNEHDMQMYSGAYVDEDGMHFNGTSAYGNAGNPALLRFGPIDFSMCFWLKAPAVNQKAMIFAKNSIINPWEQYSVGIYDGSATYGWGQRLTFTWIADGTHRKIFATDVVVLDGTWHSYCFVVEVGEGIYIYEDGVALATHEFYPLDNWGVVGPANGDNLLLGGGNAGDRMKGEIDDVRIYRDRLITLEESGILYSRGRTLAG